MFTRHPILNKWLVLTGIVFAVSAIVIILTANKFIRTSFINRSKLAVRDALQSEINDLQPQDFSLKDPTHVENVFNSFYNGIKTTEIIRIKVWDYSGKVIYSDDQSIIGQRFPDNEQYQEALKGEIIAEIGQKVKPENRTEQGYEQLLEVYVPVIFKDEDIPSGVIEVYYRLDDVNNQTKQTQIVLIITIITNILLLSVLLLVVYRTVIFKQIQKIDLQAAALDKSFDHVTITNLDGIILYVNEAAEKLTGYSKKEMIGQRPSLWGKQMSNEFYEQMWKTIKIDKKNFSGQINNKRKNGDVYQASMNVSPILDKNGNPAFFVGIERDMTKEMEIDKAKTEFVSLASHQLRTPLSAVNWYTEMLMDGNAGAITPEQKKYLDEIYRSNQRMVELVNALLNVSRIDLGTFAIDPQLTDIAEIATSVVFEQLPVITGKHLTVTETYHDDVPIMKVDPKLIRIVFQNLISNAVKYTPPEGKVTVKIITTMKDKQKDGVCISVSDTGYGIPASQQANVFTKLFRADNAIEKETDGTGLGLYVVKNIVEQAHGRVWFTSIENQGTTFFVTLPLIGMTQKKGNKGLIAG